MACSSNCSRANEKGWGEISPLPGFSLESLDDAQAALLAWAGAWREGANPALPDVPSAVFGISCALAEPMFAGRG